MQTQQTPVHTNGSSHVGAISHGAQIPSAAFQGIGEMFRPIIRATLQQELRELPNIIREEVRTAISAPVTNGGVVTLASPPRLIAAQQSCTIDGCGRAQRAKGLCSAHYQSSRRRKAKMKAKRGGGGRAK